MPGGGEGRVLTLSKGFSEGWRDMERERGRELGNIKWVVCVREREWDGGERNGFKMVENQEEVDGWHSAWVKTQCWKYPVTYFCNVSHYVPLGRFPVAGHSLVHCIGSYSVCMRWAIGQSMNALSEGDMPLLLNRRIHFAAPFSCLCSCRLSQTQWILSYKPFYEFFLGKKHTVALRDQLAANRCK